MGALAGYGIYSSLQLSRYPLTWVFQCSSALNDYSVLIKVPLNLVFIIITIGSFHCGASTSSSVANWIMNNMYNMCHLLQDQNQLQPLLIPQLQQPLQQQGQGQNNVADAG